jgi:pSer/pThr/pTyr-binding forkhead associated (FHA) protein
VFCTRCGHQNPPTARFCASCGAELPRTGDAVPPERPGEQTSTLSMGALPSEEVGEEAADDPAAVVDALPRGSALLVVRRGPNAGSRFLLDKDVTTAGRHPESDIFLDDVTVSRRHAEFHRAGETFSLRDVGSLNGTYLGRERIDVADLVGGDEVQIGKFRLVFLTARPSAAGGSGTASGQGR